MILVLLIPSVSYAFGQVRIKTEFGMKGPGNGQFSEPSDIAIDTDGKIYIADKDNKRVHVLDQDGKTIRTWNAVRGGSDLMKEPVGIALSDDRVYVTDGSNKVLIFSKTGQLLDLFGSSGSDPKQFDDPHGIFVHQNVVYVADTDNNRVQVFSLDGIYLDSIGKEGKRAGEMREPTDVAVDYRGYIYVTERGNNRIQVFSPSGKFHRSYYNVSEPASIALDSSGFVVADAGNYMIKKFSFNENLLFSFGSRGNSHSQFQKITGVAIDDRGNILTIDGEKNTVQVFSPEKSIAMPEEVAPPLNSIRLLSMYNIHVTDMAWHNDILYATSKDEDSVYFIQGGLVRKIVKKSGNVELSKPYGIAVDPGGYIWVADSGNDRLVRMDRTGRILLTVGSSGSGSGEFSEPKGIAITGKGIIYVADSDNERIQVLNIDGIFMSRITSAGRKNLDTPSDVDVDPLGNIFVTDEGKHRVVKFDRQGRYLRAFGSEGEGNGQFIKPSSIAVINDEIYVLDTGNDRVQIFDHDGRFLRKFGTEGSGKGDFKEPASISRKDASTILVADNGNKRIQEFEILYTPETPLSLKAMSVANEVLLSWTRNTKEYVDFYRIYRSDNKVHYRPVGTARSAAYTDSNVEPETLYFYKVAAVAVGGNESGKSDTVSAQAKRPTILPPSDLKAEAEETTIRLTWAPPKGDISVIYYIIYRETDGMFKPLVKARTPVYTDKGLKSDTEYTYKVTAVTKDNLQSSGAVLRSKTIRTGPALEIAPVRIHDIFPRAYKLYEKDGIGVMKLTNLTDQPVEDITLSFVTDKLMDSPAVIKVASIAPKASVEIEIKPVVFNNSILLLKENTTVKGDIQVVYSNGKSMKKFTTSQNLMVILTGRSYSEAEIARFNRALKDLDNKVRKTKTYTTVTWKIKEKLSATNEVIKSLKTKNLSYGDIVTCLYISNASRKSPDDIVLAKGGGQQWHEIMSIFEIAISDVTTVLNEISDSLVVKQKPRQRKRETERYVK